MIEELSILLRKGTENIDAMRKLVQQQVLYALKIVNEPCGAYLITKNMYQTFLKTAGYTEEEFKNYLKQQFLSQKEVLNQSTLGYVTTNPMYNLLLVYIFVFLANDEYDTAVQVSRLYGCLTLSYLKRKYFKVCNADTLRYTLDNLHGHSIARSEGFVGLVTKISDETLNKYRDVFLEKIDVYNNYRYLIDIRNKMNQSMKLIAAKYYQNMEELASGSLVNKAEEIMTNFMSVTSNPKIIEYISKLSSLSELEVEKLFIDIQQTPEAQEILKDIIVKILYVYGGEEKVLNAGVNLVLGRIRRRQEFIELSKALYESCGYDTISNDYILGILGLAIILIVWKR